MTTQQQRARAHWEAGLQAFKAQAWERAGEEFEQATRLQPDDELMWLNLARTRLAQGRLDDAVQAAGRARDAAPDSPLAGRVLAECLSQQHQHEAAADVFARHPPGAPRDFDWYNAAGNAQFMARRLQDAVGSFFQALALKVDAALVHYRLGLCFKDLGLAREATECFRTAVSLDHGSTRLLALSLLVHEGRQSCDWQHVEADTAALLAALDDADESSGSLLSPFALLAVEATPEQQRRMGALRCRGLTRHLQPLPPPGPRAPGPVRVGYLSSDFHQHATAVLMTEMLEQRDRQRFRVTLYSHGLDDGSAIGQRVRRACDQFVDASHFTHAELAQRMRDDGIDIAIDLKGHTRDSRFELLALRPAPVQASWLGYPGSTGAEFIDYLIGDPVVTPLAHAGHYSEHLAQLPHSYQPNDRARPLPPAPPRARLGLPEDAVVLCCFNQTYKLSPRMLDLWARVLAGAPRTVLWMLAWNPHAQAHLTAELQARGVAPQRVFWAPKLSLHDHIARLRAADLFLDTWPCGAHTTASEALWAGVPVLTVPGPTFASRVAASLVSACGLPDLACADADAYVARATELANAPTALAALKRHLDTGRLQQPLFDSARYARDFEALLLRMFERQQAGLPPTHLPALGEGATANPAAAHTEGEPPTAPQAAPHTHTPAGAAPPGPDEVPPTPDAAAAPLPPLPDDTLADARRAVRHLDAQLQAVHDAADALLAHQPLNTALETSLLAKVDPAAHARACAYWAARGTLTPARRSDAHFPLALAVQAVDGHHPQDLPRLRQLLDTLDNWQLAKLFRHPALPANGRWLVACIQAWLRDDAPLPLNPRGVFNLLVLAWPLLRRGDFHALVRRLRAGLPAAALATEPDDHRRARHALAHITHALRLPEDATGPDTPAAPRPAAPGTARAPLRVALCLSGQWRGHRHAGPTWRHLGLAGQAVQVFVHSWQRRGQRQPDPEIMPSVTRLFAHAPFAQAWIQAGQRHGAAALAARYPHFMAGLAPREDDTLSAAQVRAELATSFGPAGAAWAEAAQVQLDDPADPAWAGWTAQAHMHRKIEAAQQMAEAAAQAQGQPFDLMLRLRPDKPVRPGPPPDWPTLLARSQAGRIVYCEEPLGLREGLVMGDQFAAGSPEALRAHAQAWRTTQQARSEGWYGFPLHYTGHVTLAHTCLWHGVQPDKLPGVEFAPLVEDQPLPAARLRELLAQDLPDGPRDALDAQLWRALPPD